MMEYVFLKESFENGRFKKSFDKAPVEESLQDRDITELLEFGEIRYKDNFLGLRDV